MKINTTPPFYNQLVTVHDGIQVKFDHTGICEVKADLGNVLLEKYPSMFFSGDRKIIKEDTVQQEINQELKIPITKKRSGNFSQKKNLSTIY